MWRQNAEEEEDNSDDDAPRTRSYVGYSMPVEPAATVPALIGGGVDTVGGAGTVEIAVHRDVANRTHPASSVVGGSAREPACEAAARGCHDVHPAHKRHRHL